MNVEEASNVCQDALLYLSTLLGIRNDIYVMFGKALPQSESSATLVHAI